MAPTERSPWFAPATYGTGLRGTACSGSRTQHLLPFIQGGFSIAWESDRTICGHTAFETIDVRDLLARPVCRVCWSRDRLIAEAFVDAPPEAMALIGRRVLPDPPTDVLP